MIKWEIDKQDRLTIGQQDMSPSVYLDHWAFCTFSEDDELSSRLTRALESQRGTLVLSWLNFSEFARMNSERQARAAESFVDANIPRIFFQQADPFAVIDREDALLEGGQHVQPHGDLAFLEGFALRRSDSLKLFTARDLFKAVQDNLPAQTVDALADTIIERVQAMRDRLNSDEGFQAAVKRLPYGKQIQRGTRYVLRELVRTFLVDKQIKLTRNQAIDLLHAVVPVSYCDLVLLDKHWQTQVDRVRARIESAGLQIPIAEVFSAKSNDVDLFLQELESN